MKHVDEIVEGFLSFLSQTGQKDLLPQIVEKLEDVLSEEKETAYVTSAIELTAEEEEKIKAYLVEKFSKNFKIKVIVDPKVIGGLKITVGDMVIDQTVINKLNLLIEDLTN